MDEATAQSNRRLRKRMIRRTLLSSSRDGRKKSSSRSNKRCAIDYSLQMAITERKKENETRGFLAGAMGDIGGGTFWLFFSLHARKIILNKHTHKGQASCTGFFSFELVVLH